MNSYTKEELIDAQKVIYTRLNKMIKAMHISKAFIINEIAKVD